MKRSLRTLSVLAGFAAAAASSAVGVYGVTTSNNLVLFDSASPSTVTTIGAINFSAGDRLVGLDFRSNGGTLYALGYNATTKKGNVYTINKATGAVTSTQLLDVDLNGTAFGVDFNPFADRLRIVSNSGQDLRVNLTGASPVTTVDGTLTYQTGDTFDYETPNVVAVGYTNSQIGPANAPATPRPATKLYYIDSALDTLATTTNPNAGILNTVGYFGGTVNATNLSDVDIYSSGSSNTMFLVTNSAAGSSFQTINLATGAASAGSLLGGDRISLIAAQPVPEPASMVALAVGAAALLRKRRKA